MGGVERNEGADSGKGGQVENGKGDVGPGNVGSEGRMGQESEEDVKGRHRDSVLEGGGWCPEWSGYRGFGDRTRGEEEGKIKARGRRGYLDEKISALESVVPTVSCGVYIRFDGIRR